MITYIIIIFTSYSYSLKTPKRWHIVVVFVYFFFPCHCSYEKSKTTRSWSSSVIDFYLCSSQRESSLLLCFWSFEKVENSVNSLSVCFLMCHCSFVNVGAFKRLVFILLDFGRTCFVYFWFFFPSIWLLIKVFVWICKIAMGRRRKLKKVCCDRKVQE